MKRLGKILSVLVLLAILAAAFLLSFGSTPTKVRRPMPEPNGYDDFVKAGAAYHDSTNWLSDHRGDVEMFVATNANALKMVRAGLTHECQLPADYSSAYAGLSIGYQMRVKGLASALKCEGTLAEMNDQSDLAAKTYLEVVRFGHESMRGGMIIHRLIVIAIERIGILSLQRLIPRLNASQCRESIRTLEHIAEHREPLEDAFAEESRWYRLACPLKDKIMFLIEERTLDPDRESRESLSKAELEAQRRMRSLGLALAARAYEVEHGRPPGSTTDLVPAYLKAIPTDPLTGIPLVLPP